MTDENDAIETAPDTQGGDAEVAAYMDAATALIHCTLQRVRENDSAAFDGLIDCVKNGASFRVTTFLSTAGVSRVDVALVSLKGESMTLSEIEFGE